MLLGGNLREDLVNAFLKGFFFKKCLFKEVLDLIELSLYFFKVKDLAYRPPIFCLHTLHIAKVLFKTSHELIISIKFASLELS